VLDRFWSLVTVVAFWVWVTSAVFFILRVFGGPGEFKRMPAIRWGGAWFAGFVLWMLAMLIA
jgi:hypothetical protein